MPPSDRRDDRLQPAEPRAPRARLKIYFGAAPGVGTTYSMLEQARRAKAAGDDVVIGIVETHARSETERLLAGMPIVPRRAIGHHGELDLDAALARRPTCLLVDELAHTNPPGSKHVKRWQDVVELLDAGIDVHTTLDVQHVESLGDVIRQITGIEVRETVPDAVLERAADIELVDISPDELLARRADGKLDVPERTGHDVFEKGTLLALRELALRRTADLVDADVRAYRAQHGISPAWSVSERLLVAIGPSPGSERLIRATKRIAEGMHAAWTAATVEVLGAPPLGDKDRERLENHLRLAESLGATVSRLAGVSIAEALLAHAREQGVTRIVAGKPTHPRWRDRLRGSLLDALIRGSGTIEIDVISPLEVAEPTRSRATPAERVGVVAYLSAVGVIAAITSIGLVVFPYATLADITMLYLIAIAVASLFGRGPSLLASSIAVATFDLCFVPPRFTFTVSDTNHLLTFAVMFGSGLAISTLTGRLRTQERDAVIRERNTAALFAFTRDIAAATTPDDVAAVTVRHLEDMFPVAASVVVVDRHEPTALVAVAGLLPLAAQEQAVARWAIDHGEAAGLGTDTLPGAHILAVPLVAGDSTVGALAVQARHDPRRLGGASLSLLEAFGRQTALALARTTFAEQARDAAVRAHTEELRSSLLSAVSHDLRTPLAVITGAATSLRDDSDHLTPAARTELLTSIVDDAARLERVLGNLLQLTRVESGLVPNREWIPVEELVGAALTRVEDVMQGKPLALEVEADLMVPVDPVLFEHVLINLIDNALKHGAPPLELCARTRDGLVVIEVRDHGSGIPDSVGSQLFDKFVRASSAPGAGLGLAVVRAIVIAHGGAITVDNAPGGGARFRIELPAEHPTAPRPQLPAPDLVARSG